MRTTTFALSVSFVLAACGASDSSGPQPDPTIVAVDAGPDASAAVRDAGAAPLDAPPGEIDYDYKYEVAYIDEITIAPGATNLDSILGLLLVVNTGTAPLDLSTASVVSSSDDSDDVVWTLSRYSGSTAVLEPGHAAGCLSPVAADEIITRGLVTEPGGGCADYDQGLDFGMYFSGGPAAGVTYHARAALRIGGVDIDVPFTIHGDDTHETSGVVLNGATRISSHP